MPLVKRLLVFVFLIAFLQFLAADEIQVSSELKHKENVKFYAGINPLALIAFLPDGMGTAGTVYGITSGQEFGISLYGGMYYADAHSLEMRFSTGPADLVVWDTQLQLGYIWYPFEQFLNWNGGLCSGFMLRQFFWYNKITDNVTFNLTPELLLGWRFKVKSLAIDLRAGWNFASVSWSDIPHTKETARWTPFPYNLVLATGIIWIFN